MTRTDMLEIVMHADGLPLTFKAMAIMAINVASAEQLQQAAIIFERAETIFKEQGVEGLRAFLLQAGVPQEGLAIIERYATAAEANANSTLDAQKS